MIIFESKGDFKNTDRFFKKMSRLDVSAAMKFLGERGVQALRSGTPVDSGLASESWDYEITKSKRSSTITWINYDVENGFPVAIMLQYGYATGTGGYVRGIDYINPAIRPIFDEIAEELWKVVTSA